MTKWLLDLVPTIGHRMNPRNGKPIAFLLKVYILLAYKSNLLCEVIFLPHGLRCGNLMLMN